MYGLAVIRVRNILEQILSPSLHLGSRYRKYELRLEVYWIFVYSYREAVGRLGRPAPINMSYGFMKAPK